MMRRFNLWRRATFAVLVGGALALGVAGGSATAGDACTASFEPSHTWEMSVPGHLMREFTVPFCGSDALSLNVDVDWKGKKDVVVYLVEPDGTEHRYLAQSSEVAASMAAPLDHGSWTLRVWNLSPGAAKIIATVDFE